jgi:hypothetical protein
LAQFKKDQGTLDSSNQNYYEVMMLADSSGELDWYEPTAT